MVAATMASGLPLPVHDPERSDTRYRPAIHRSISFHRRVGHLAHE
jgi:hypothetical protein